VQHLAMFVPWDAFLSETSGDINTIWERHQRLLPPRLSFFADNIQLLRRSAEDAKRDAKQWAAISGEVNPEAEVMGPGDGDVDGDGDCSVEAYRADDIGVAMRLIDVFRSALGPNQITAGSKEVAAIIEQLHRFDQVALGSVDDLRAVKVVEGAASTTSSRGGALPDAYNVPEQEKVRSIKSQQTSLSKERERMIQGIQEQRDNDTGSHAAAVDGLLSGFGEDDFEVRAQESENQGQSRGPSTTLQFGPSTSFSEAGRQVAASLTFNRMQSVALRLLCRQLDQVHRNEGGTHHPQLCQFIGGEGGTGKSRIIEAVVRLFASKRLSHRLLVTATSGTAAAGINGITIHSACNFSKDGSRSVTNKNFDRFATPTSASLRVDGQSKMQWQEKYMLVIDEVSMLGARTLYNVNEKLCMLRGSAEDFGGIPIVLFLGDFRQFRPVQERTILLHSKEIPWDEEKMFAAEQRHQHDKAHALWNKFTTVVMLKEQVRAAGDPQLQRLLTRIRQGVQDQSDLELLNSACYREDMKIPWESGITVVTPLNRNRWNLNIEAALSYQRQHRATLRIFISEHKWKDGEPTEEEALMILNHGDDSGIPIPAVFMFVPGMPIMVTQNTHQALKVVNGASYAALDVVLDKKYPGHRISADTILHFGPPAAILLKGDSTMDFHFVGMPPGTILLTPLSSRIECARKRPWQRHDVVRRGLPCTAAFACTDYKVQSRTLDSVALELRGTRSTTVDGKSVPSQCDAYSLYVQLSRCRSLDGIMLLSKARDRDVVGNRVPDSMLKAERRLEKLSEATIREAESWWDW